MFRGRSNRSIDPKGRLMLPPEYREELVRRDSEGRFMLTTLDKAVIGYPMDKWMDIEAKFSKIPNPSQQVRNFMRLFIGSAHEMTLDKQGRILLPPTLREYGALDKDVTVVGVVEKFEIWNRERYEALFESQIDGADVADAIAATGVEVNF